MDSDTHPVAGLGGNHVSFVVPVYRGAEFLGDLTSRIFDAMPHEASCEVILVDDASPDESWPVMVRLARRDPRIRPYRLSRNFGQEAATSAGLAVAQGSRIVVMDCDLQDAPEDAWRLVQHSIETEADIVWGRRDSHGGGRLRGLASKTYFAIVNRLAGSQIDGGYGAFSCMTSRVRDAYLELGDRDRNFLMILHWLGFERSEIAVTHGARPGGGSSYTFRALVRHALRGAFFQTTAPLRWVIYVGFVESLIGLAFATHLIFERLTGHVVAGWTSLMVALLLTSGTVILSTGIAALYVGRIFEQVKARPRYVVGRYPDDVLEMDEP